MTLRTLALPLKVLATCFLLTIGLGYLCAITYLYLVDLEPHTKQHLGMVRSVITKYYGNREDTRLEGVLNGAMAEHVTPSEKQQIIRWIRQGAGEAEYVKIQPIFTQACVGCHSPDSGLPIPPLTSYAQVSAYTALDFGQSVKSLVKVSHIHLFGMSFIFMLTSIIFSLSETPKLFRAALIAIPFLAVWVDIGSWWFTKYEPIFAYAVIVGGTFMGLSLGCQILISLYEMWLKRN